MELCKRVGKWPTVTAGLAVLTLALTGAASADKEKIKFTAAGQAAARAVVLKKVDFGSVTGWKGGMKKPDLSSSFKCASYHPKQSDLVLIGAVESDWTHTSGLSFDSEAQVLETAQMVKLDWQRTVMSPKVVPCLKQSFIKELGSKASLVSLHRISVPRISTHTAAFRIVMDVKSSGRTVRVMSDLIAFGAGRTEVTLTSVSPYAARDSVRSAEISAATVLATRIRA